MVAEIARQIEAGLDAASVAARVLDAIRENELYIFTHPGMRAKVGGAIRRHFGRDGSGRGPIILIAQGLMALFLRPKRG